jgi:hydroxymethylglutaryl-CoA reductase
MKAAIVAAVMSVLELIELWGGFSTGVTQDWILSLMMILTPILVWFVPGWFGGD